MYPLGRTAFDELDGLRYAKRRGQCEHQMNVILHTPYFEGCDVILPRNAAHVGPKPFAESRTEARSAILGAEDTVEIGTDVRHGDDGQPSLWDSWVREPWTQR